MFMELKPTPLLHPGLVATAVTPIADALHFYDRFSKHKDTKAYTDVKDAR
jgi:hypothetical protein